MKTSVIALLVGLLAACHHQGKSHDLPTRPDEATFRAASPSAQCDLTAPRATQCTDELIVASVRSAVGSGDGGDDFARAVESDLAKDTHESSAKEERDMHTLRCLGDARYADAIFTCWSQPDCTKLADCVLAQQQASHPPKSASSAEHK